MPDSCLLNPAQECYGLKKAQELEDELAELRRQNSSSHERIFDRLGALETNDAVQRTQYEVILEKLDTLSERHSELSRKLGELEAKPGKRWEAIVAQVVSLVVAALVGAVIARLGF